MLAQAAINYFVLTFTLVGLFLLVGSVLLLSRMYKPVQPGQAMIINKPSGKAVTFTGMVVIPWVHIVTWVDVSHKQVRVALQDVRCLHGFRLDLEVEVLWEFIPAPLQQEELVLELAQLLGPSPAPDAIEEMLRPTIIHAVRALAVENEASIWAEKRWQCSERLSDELDALPIAHRVRKLSLLSVEPVSMDRYDPKDPLDRSVLAMAEQDEHKRQTQLWEHKKELAEQAQWWMYDAIKKIEGEPQRRATVFLRIPLMYTEASRMEFEHVKAALESFLAVEADGEWSRRVREELERWSGDDDFSELLRCRELLVGDVHVTGIMG